MLTNGGGLKRDIQSMTFFNAAGIDPLCSGVAMSTASAALIRSYRRMTGAGKPTWWRSKLYIGRSPISTTCIVIDGGISSSAARSAFRLRESRRRLPHIATTSSFLVAFMMGPLRQGLVVELILGSGGKTRHQRILPI